MGVIGIGVFVKSPDVKALGEWYGRVLGLDIQEWGKSRGAGLPADAFAAKPNAAAVWSAHPSDSTHFAPSGRDFMINLCVDDLDAVLARAKSHGVEPIWREDADDFGRFAHLIDPDGTKVELWEPKA
jgi:predicted enzyme related to lactoylglutathione lyase